MSSPFTIARRPASTPASSDHPRCVVFKWIGQSLDSCDDCGRPIEVHLYDPPYGTAPMLFSVKEFSHSHGWHWTAVGGVLRKRTA